LCFERTAKDDGFIAGFMVTDERGYPLEFRATTPVRPTLVQRTLYGKQLEHYVGIELCGKTLVQNASRKPNVVLVPETWLLDLASAVPTDVVAIWRAGETMHVQSEEPSAGTRGSVALPGSQALIYEGRFVKRDDGNQSVIALEESAARFDLVDAFDRMRSALQLLAKEDQRYA
jgi:hypothetical protein